MLIPNKKIKENIDVNRKMLKNVKVSNLILNCCLRMFLHIYCLPVPYVLGQDPSSYHSIGIRIKIWFYKSGPTNSDPLHYPKHRWANISNGSRDRAHLEQKSINHNRRVKNFRTSKRKDTRNWKKYIKLKTKKVGTQPTIKMNQKTAESRHRNIYSSRAYIWSTKN